MESKGIADYLVELGGEIRIKGRKQPSGEKMTVGIESPGDDSNGSLPVIRTIQLDHGAVTTSGNYRKFYQNGSKKITHLINPKTGYPIENEMISVTVVAEDAITADAYDNALMNMGLKKAMKFVNRQKNLEAYFIYHKPDGSVADTASAGFY
jgi:FAD:protein FMN transferase